MSWFLTARRVPVVVVPGIVVFALITALGRQRLVPVPDLLGGSLSNPVFVPQLAPVVVTSVLGYGLSRRLVEAESCAIRRVYLADAGLIVAVCAVACAAAAVVTAVTDSAHAAQAARNLPFLIGIMLITMAIQPQAATAVPVAWLLVVLMLGYHEGIARHWAITAAGARSLPALAFCPAVLIIGVACYLTRYRK